MLKDTNYFQATYTCSGDSGSPLVNSNQLIGVLHGSSREKCVFSASIKPSLFANVTYPENTNFIRNWISLGATLDYQNDPLFNYLKVSTKSKKRKHNLWAPYKSAALVSSINEKQQYMELQTITPSTTTPPPSTTIDEGISECPERIFVQGGTKNGTYVKLGEGFFGYYQLETNEKYCLWRHLDHKYWLLGYCDALWEYVGFYWLPRKDTICPNQDYEGYRDWKTAGENKIANMTVSAM